MKKILVGILSISALILTGCSNTFGNKNTKSTTKYLDDNTSSLYESTKMSYVGTNDGQINNQNIKRIFSSYQASPLTNDLYELNGESYGRIISSSISKENAKEVCLRHFTYKNNKYVDCNVIYENDMLYGINVKWDCKDGGKYEENVISFKKDIADIIVRNVVYNDQESFNIKTKDKEQLEKLALYLYEYKYPYRGIHSYIVKEDENEFVIETYYKEDHVFMDWGLLSDMTIINEGIIKINTKNGNVSTNFKGTTIDKVGHVEIYED